MITREKILAQQEFYRRPIAVGEVAVKVLTEHNRHFGLLDGVDVPGKTVVEIDPGYAFGDGTHPTTKMCLLALQEHLRPGCRMLDIGCGSGILGITALRLGAQSVRAVDIDPRAVKTAVKNAERNGVAGDFQAVVGDLAGDAEGEIHLVTANLLPEPLLRLLPKLPGLLASGGCALLSGIRAERAAEVKEVARRYLRIKASYEQENWVSLVLTRKEEGI